MSRILGSGKPFRFTHFALDETRQCYVGVTGQDVTGSISGRMLTSANVVEYVPKGTSKIENYMYQPKKWIKEGNSNLLSCIGYNYLENDCKNKNLKIYSNEATNSFVYFFSFAAGSHKCPTEVGWHDRLPLGLSCYFVSTDGRSWEDSEKVLYLKMFTHEPDDKQYDK